MNQATTQLRTATVTCPLSGHKWNFLAETATPALAIYPPYSTLGLARNAFRKTKSVYALNAVLTHLGYNSMTNVSSKTQFRSIESQVTRDDIIFICDYLLNYESLDQLVKASIPMWTSEEPPLTYVRILKEKIGYIVPSKATTTTVTPIKPTYTVSRVRTTADRKQIISKARASIHNNIQLTTLQKDRLNMLIVNHKFLDIKVAESLEQALHNLHLDDCVRALVIERTEYNKARTTLTSEFDFNNLEI